MIEETLKYLPLIQVVLIPALVSMVKILHNIQTEVQTVKTAVAVFDQWIESHESESRRRGMEVDRRFDRVDQRIDRVTRTQHFGASETS